MKKFSKLIAVVLAIAVIICPMMSVVSHATTTNGYKIEANPNDANELMLTISSTDGFVAYDATVTFNSTDAFQDDCNTGDYVDGLRLISYEVDGGEGNSHNLPRIYSSMPNDTTLKMIVIKNDFSATGMYTELVIGIRVAAGSTATLTKIQAADEGTVADDPTLLTFPAANESTGEIDQTDEYAKENATITVHTHDLTLVPANDPTCTVDGNYAYYTCSGCDKIFSDENGETETTLQAVKRLATGHSFTNYVSNNDATCTQDGTKTAYCDHKCGTTKTITDEGSALGHNMTHHDAASSTCLVQGNIEYYSCSRCKKLFANESGATELTAEQIKTALAAHTPSKAVVENDVASTCTTAGHYQEVVYCSVCGVELSRDTYNKELKAHSYGEWTTDADGHSRTCSVCGTVDSGKHDGNPCTICGYEAVAECTHVNKHFYTDSTHMYVPATGTSTAETSKGRIYFQCDDCGEIIEEVVSYYQYYCTGTSNLNLASEISANFYLRSDHYNRQGAPTDAIIVLNKEKVGADSIDTVYKLSETASSTANGKPAYMASVSVAAKEMNDVISSYVFVLYNGNWYNGISIQKSIKTFAMASITAATSSSNPLTLKKLYANMLVYGAKAQLNFNYDTDNLADSDLEGYQDLINDAEPEIVDHGVNNLIGNLNHVGFHTYALSLGAKVEISIGFRTDFYKGDESLGNFYPRATYVTVDGIDKTWDTTDFSLMSGYSDRYSFFFDGVAAKDMRQLVTFQICNENGDLGYSLVTSVETVARKLIDNNSKNTALCNVVKAMMNYGDAAAAYFAP